MSADWLAACETADSLVYDSLKDRGGQILLGRSVIDQGLDVRLGKNAASCRDRIKRLVIPGILVQTRSVGLKQGRHLVDKGTGAACADAIHALFYISVFKVNNLRVFSAQFNGYVCLGRIVLQSRRNRYNLLDKRNVQMFCESESS